MQHFFYWMANHWVAIVVAGSFVIQIVPIKWNPWTSIFNWIRKIMLGDLEKAVKNMERTIDENEKDRIRWEVLDFANSCRNGREHSKDEFQHIITIVGKYEGLLKKTGDKNGVFTAEYKYIMRLYNQGKFIGGKQ